MAGEITAGSLRALSINNGHIATAAGIERTKLATEALTVFPQDILNLRVWDAVGSLLPTAGASDDLGLITGTWATGPTQVQTGDLKSVAGPTTRRCGTILRVPENYVAGGGLQIRCRAGMKTTVADTTATIDVEAYEILSDGTLSGSPTDLVQTSATTINSLTYADKSFILDPTDLAPGDRLAVRFSIAIADAAGVTAVIGVLHSYAIACDIKG